MDGTIGTKKPKPRLRGLSHLLACVLVLPGWVVLVRLAQSDRARLAAHVYGATLVALFGLSALYHVPTWRPEPRRWLRRLDHAGIFLFIAGTYTPFCLSLPDGGGRPVLLLVWAGAIGGVLQSLFWVGAPRPVTAALYLLVGWVILPYVPAFHAALGTEPLLLVFAGGVAYSAGAVVYARRRPDPVPHVFGYHEVFHLLVVAASVLHFAAVVRVIPMVR